MISVFGFGFFFFLVWSWIILVQRLLFFQDTRNHEDLDRFRGHIYAYTDLFLVVFSIVNQYSLKNVEDKVQICVFLSLKSLNAKPSGCQKSNSIVERI
jgi:GTPase SAR1 family protein